MFDMISQNSTVSAAGEQDVAACQLDGEVVLLNLHQGTYYGLDEVGAYIWNSMQQARPVAEIHQDLLRHYDVEPELCAHDLLNLLNQLEQAGLITVHNEPTGQNP